MLKSLILKVIENIKNSQLAKDKKHLIHTVASVIIVLVVLVAIFVIRSGSSPMHDIGGIDGPTVTAIAVISTDDVSATPTPSPSPTPTPPAITPPAIEPDPASGTDILFTSEPPATDTDIG